MQYRILGPLEVVDGDQSIDIGSRQQRGLLALLLLNANRIVSTQCILEEFWPDDPVGKERTVWVYVSRLRAILEPDRPAHANGRVLVTRDQGYTLVVDDGDIDARRFEHLAMSGSRLLEEDAGKAADVLDDALALWRGAAVEEFRYAEFAQADVARLEELRLGAAEDRIDADIRTGGHRSVIGDLEKLVVQHPHRERLVSLQMIALYRAGCQADALRAFDAYRRRIDAELGIVPSPELRRIEEQVLLHDSRLSPSPDSLGTLGPTVVANPFKGLQAFGESDAGFFFGRDRVVTELVRRLDEGATFLALVGASGSGKSSVLRAGLVPALKRAAIEASDDWRVAQMVPGSRPFRELEAALSCVAPEVPAGPGALLNDREDGLLRACLHVLGSSSRILLVIDQFEELFTLGAAKQEQDRFIRNLEVALDDGRGRVAVAIGLRADFYGRPLEYPRFAQLLGDGIVNVAPMALDELELAAERPVEQVGATLEPALVVQLLADVAGQVGGLPLFQYALTELFDMRSGSTLTLAAYHSMGGISGALARRAEELYLALSEAERLAARQLFLRLVTIVDQGAWSRRRVSGAEIVTVAADLVALQSVLQRFGEHRLLTFDRESVSDSPTVEVAHEALLVEWPRLRSWIDDGQQDVVRHARLTTALGEWTASGEKTDYLLSGERLADYAAWASTSSLQLGRDEERFLDESMLREQQLAMVEERRHAREIKRDQQAKARLWGLAIGGAMIVAAVVTGLFVLPGGGQPAIALVHGASPDLGINDMMISGVGLAERAHDIVVDLEPPLVAPEEHLRLLAESGADLIIVGNDFDEQIDRLAPVFPDVHWVAIDPAAVHDENPNVTKISFAVEESAYLAGAAAALTTQTGRVGFVGGVQSFRTESSRSGFEQGATTEGVDVEVVSTFIGPVAPAILNADRGEELAYDLASQMYADGVDVIFHDADEAGNGVTRAAVDWSEGNGAVWAIGSDTDEYYTTPGGERHVVLTSTVKRFDTAVETAISEFVAGDLKPGEAVLDLEVRGVGLSRSGGHLGGLDASLTTLESELRLGHIDVSPSVERGPTFQEAPDVTVELTLTDEACRVERITGGVRVDDGFLPVPRGSTVLVELVNASSREAGLIVHNVPSDVTVDQLELESRSGIPESLGALHLTTVAQLGGATSGAVVVAGSNLSINCSIGPLGGPEALHFPPIVRPT